VQLLQLFSKSLSIDGSDVEANFNVGSILMQLDLPQLAMRYLKRSVRKDESSELPEVRSLFRSQFAKAYFNIALLADKDGDTQQAMTYYEKAFLREKSSNDPPSSCFVKAATNLAVCYEKLGFRSKSIEVCEVLQDKGIVVDSKLNNNLGVLHKREGRLEEAIEGFNRSLQAADSNFFATYNLGVTLAALKQQGRAIALFEAALGILEK